MIFCSWYFWNPLLSWGHANVSVLVYNLFLSFSNLSVSLWSVEWGVSITEELERNTDSQTLPCTYRIRSSGVASHKLCFNRCFFLSRDNLRVAALDWSFLISTSLVISPPTVFRLPEIMDFSWQTCFLLLSLLCFHDRGHKYICLRDKANKINEWIGWVTGTGSERNYGSFP